MVRLFMASFRLNSFDYIRILGARRVKRDVVRAFIGHSELIDMWCMCMSCIRGACPPVWTHGDGLNAADSDRGALWRALNVAAFHFTAALTRVRSSRAGPARSPEPHSVSVWHAAAARALHSPPAADVAMPCWWGCTSDVHPDGVGQSHFASCNLNFCVLHGHKLP